MTQNQHSVATKQPEQRNGAVVDLPTLVQLRGLSKSYREAGQEHEVLASIDWRFPRGQFSCLFGKSGSGKSTLLNLISGIDQPSGGQVLIHENEMDVDLTALSDHERTLFRRRNIGIVFQFFNLIPTLTVLENVSLPIELAGGDRKGHRRAADLLARVGLGDRLDSFPDKLSGGEQQRVAIARALVHDPALVLADEPTGNLDEGTGDTVLDLLLELSRNAGKTLIMATHDPDIAQYADQVLYLEHGKLVSHRARD
ncbi:MAG: ABC transporter ATP-binding protein [Caldilineaceae bacterium]|nr:ABC transporter ATP-binding protein [Caldilineaceae bacterium]